MAKGILVLPSLDAGPAIQYGGELATDEVLEVVLHILEMLEGMQRVEQHWKSRSMCWKSSK